MVLEEGEKYITVKLLNSITVSAFKNKDKKGNEPDYKGDGVAIWINKKKGAATKEETEL